MLRSDWLVSLAFRRNTGKPRDTVSYWSFSGFKVAILDHNISAGCFVEAEPEEVRCNLLLRLQSGTKPSMIVFSGLSSDVC